MSKARKSRCSCEASRMGEAGGELNDEGGECPSSSRDDNVVDAVAEEVWQRASMGILKPFAFLPSKPSVTSRMSRITSSSPEGTAGSMNLEASSSCLATGCFGCLKPSTAGLCGTLRLVWAERPDDLRGRGLAVSFGVTSLKLAPGTAGSTLFTGQGKHDTQAQCSLPILTFLLHGLEVWGPEAVSRPTLTLGCSIRSSRRILSPSATTTPVDIHDRRAINSDLPGP
jgi:hypothetical protein